MKKIYAVTGFTIVIILIFSILLSGYPFHRGSINNVGYTPPFSTPTVYGLNLFGGNYSELYYQVNSHMYSLPIDLSLVQNYKSLTRFLDPKASALLSDNGFVVLNGDYLDLSKTYEEFAGSGYPIYVSTDSILYLYHTLFDKILSILEEKYFYGNLTILLDEAVKDAYKIYLSSDDKDVKEAAILLTAYLSVPLKILDEEYAVPNIVSDSVSRELDLILSIRSPEEESPIFHYKEDYSQYIPRGHYTISEKLKKYFMAMMWLGRMRFEAKDPYEQEKADAQTRAAILLTYIISTHKIDGVPLLNIWEKIYLPTAYIVGFSDDLTFYDYIDGITEIYSNFTPNMLYDKGKLHRFQDVIMEKDKSKIRNTIWSVESESTLPGLRFMGQRFILDGYIHQMLCYPNIEFRTMVKGLDVMAVLGSDEALNYLDEDIRKYPGYIDNLDNLTSYVSDLPNKFWWSTLYNGWLYTIKAELTSFNSSYPAYMNTTAWLDKSLNTALSSWAQLRHDTILYAKQPYAAKTSLPPQPPDAGYVEPIPRVYHRLTILINNTENGLFKLGLLDDEMKGKLDLLYNISSNLLDISLKELNDTPISDEDARFIRNISYMFNEALEFGESELSDPRVIADVFTNPNANRVLEVGTGYFDIILVAYKGKDGNIYVSIGLVMSYHEFTWPTQNRLTDQEWRQMLEQDSTIGIQSWIKNYEIIERL